MLPVVDSLLVSGVPDDASIGGIGDGGRSGPCMGGVFAAEINIRYAAPLPFNYMMKLC